MGAGVEAEGPRRPEVVAVEAVPHEGVGDDNVGFGVADAANWVFAGRRSELQLAGGAGQDVSVEWASAAVVNAEWVVDWDFAA